MAGKRDALYKQARLVDKSIKQAAATATFCADAAWHNPGEYRGMALTESKQVMRGAETETEFLGRLMEREAVGESSERLRQRQGSLVVARDASEAYRTCKHDGRNGRTTGRDCSRYTPSAQPTNVNAKGQSAYTDPYVRNVK